MLYVTEFPKSFDLRKKGIANSNIVSAHLHGIHQFSTSVAFWSV